jgi:hypothetical protein
MGVPLASQWKAMRRQLRVGLDYFKTSEGPSLSLRAARNLMRIVRPLSAGEILLLRHFGSMEFWLWLKGR